jgi:L-seryl-tRNA(Ser) seleniumtransferase
MVTFSPSFNRRAFVKWAAALPLLGQIAAQDLFATVQETVGKPAAENVYRRLGVRTLINGRGQWTYLSGSLELPEVRAAQLEAAKYFVNIVELQHAVGKRLAELTGAESGMITSGAAGAIAAATASCLAGCDPAKIWQLPDTAGLKHEVLMVGGRSPFDSAVRLTGAKLVTIHAVDDLQDAITDQTAMIYTTDLGDRLAREIAIAKNARVPLLLDDAAGIPPIENVKLYARMGADLYTFSGGKGLMGPQCSGLLLGRKDLIEAAVANCSPWEGAVCRPMKVGKEEIIGCLTALETWLKMDPEALYREWNGRVQRIAKLVETVPGVKTEIIVPEGANRFPTLTITWDQNAWGFTVADCARKLSDGDPRIEVLTKSNPSLVPGAEEGYPNPKEPQSSDQLQIVSVTLRPGEEMIVGKRLREVLGTARKATGRAS